MQASSDQELETIIPTHYRLVWMAAYRILGNADDAADVAQETFVRYFQKRPAQIDSISSWLHTVATRVALDLRKSDVKRQMRETKYGDSMIARDGEALSPDILWELDAAIERLPDSVRVPVIEHYLRKRTHKAIAKDLNVARQTVSKRIDDGVTQIREDLSKLVAPGTSLALLAYLEFQPDDIAWASLQDQTQRAVFSNAKPSPISTAPAPPKPPISLSPLGYVAAPVIVASVAIAAWIFSTGPSDVSARQVPENGQSIAENATLEPNSEPETLVIAQRDTPQIVENVPAPISLPEDLPSDIERRIEEKLPPDIPDALRGDGVGFIENGNDWVNIHGTVVNMEGKPIEDAMVVVSASGHVGIEADRAAFAGHRSPSRRYITKTDSKGRYEISDVAYGGSARVAAGNPDYPATSHHIGVVPGEIVKEVDFILVHADAITPSVKESSQIRVTNEDGSVSVLDVTNSSDANHDKAGMVIRGKLVDEAGQPISNAFLTVPIYVSDEFLTTTTARNSTVTNNEGEFALRVWHEVSRRAGTHGLASIIVSTSDGDNATFSSVPFGNDENPVLTFPRSATLRGRVQAPDWAPNGPYWIGVAEILEESGDGLSSRHDYGLCSSFGGWTQEDGSFEIPNIPSKRRFQLTVFNAKNFDVTPRKFIEPLQPGELRDLDLSVYDGHLIEGYVKAAETGEPVGHVRVGAYHPDRETAQSEYCWADENGHYILCLPRDLQGVRVFATFDASGFSAMAAMVERFGKDVRISGPGPTTLDLVMPKPIPIELHVVDERGEPVPGVSVWRINTPFGTTDQNGVFNTFHNPEFERAFKLQKSGYLTVNSATYLEPIDPDSDKRTTVLTRAAGGIEGQTPNINTDHAISLSLTVTFEDGRIERTQTAALLPGQYFILSERFRVGKVAELHVKCGNEFEKTYEDIEFEQGVVIDLGALE